MNRQTKRQMAKQGADKPSRPEKRAPQPREVKERTGIRQYFMEVRGEFKKVAWPPRHEIINSTIIVIIGLIVMTTLIFAFDWASVHVMDFVFG
jgi:preprotein translocase subunit SecE